MKFTVTVILHGLSKIKDFSIYAGDIETAIAEGEIHGEVIKAISDDGDIAFGE